MILGSLVILVSGLRRISDKKEKQVRCVTENKTNLFPKERKKIRTIFPFTATTLEVAVTPITSFTLWLWYAIVPLCNNTGLTRMVSLLQDRIRIKILSQKERNKMSSVLNFNTTISEGEGDVIPSAPSFIFGHTVMSRH